jgi:multicomponent Na+:H+ antiporter subunit F
MTLSYGLIVLAGAAALLACYRLLKGPTRADRVVALDLLFAVAVVLCLSAALLTRRTAFLDVGIGLALVGFVGTVAWARLIERGRDDGPEEAP